MEQNSPLPSPQNKTPEAPGLHKQLCLQTRGQPAHSSRTAVEQRSVTPLSPRKFHIAARSRQPPAAPQAALCTAASRSSARRLNSRSLTLAEGSERRSPYRRPGAAAPPRPPPRRTREPLAPPRLGPRHRAPPLAAAPSPPGPAARRRRPGPARLTVRSPPPPVGAARPVKAVTAASAPPAPLT